MGKWRYGVILDAGSSGTRAYVYKWLKEGKARSKASTEELGRLPELHTKKDWTKKIHPGVSTFGEKPELVGPDHLKGLIDHALSIVPSDEVKHTPVFMLATAGMRLLPDYQRTAVLANICSYFRMNSNFQLADCDLHIQVIPGATEGLYGWIAANYLLGGFNDPVGHDHGQDHHTYGFLDMGGASAQIAFAPNATEAEKHANDLTLLRLRTVGGDAREYRVFVVTWLEYGANEARRRYLEALSAASPGATELPDPCLPSGLVEDVTGKVSESTGEVAEPHLLGTGKFTECLRQTFPLVDKDAPCPDPPCLFHGVHVPAIDFNVNHFVGVSEYWHTTRTVFLKGEKDVAYDFRTYQARVDEFCSQSWTDIQAGISTHKWGKKTDAKTAAEICFKSSWLINMLHEGIGIPRVGLEHAPSTDNGASNDTKKALETAKSKGFLEPFQAVDKIDGTEVSWTLGKMVLYAASQQSPAAADVLDVGFGSNIPGTALPADFQYAGSEATHTMPATDAPESLDWHDKLFAQAGHRRVPGIVLFLLIIAVALFLLCGRERRSAFLAKVLDPFSRSGSGSGKPKKRGLLDRLLNTSRGHKYEHVGTPSADDFELGDVDSDDDEGLYVVTSSPKLGAGRAAGWSTPKIVAETSPTLNMGSPKSGKGYFDYSSMGAGRGEERLSVRTESRERLSQGLGTSLDNPAVVSGTRSRHASPTRRASPLGPLKSSLD